MIVDVETAGVVVLEVLLDLLDQLVLHADGTASSQKMAGMPDWRARVTASLTQSRIGASLTWQATPDVAGFDVLRQQHFAGDVIDDVGDAGFGDFEGLVVRAVFFGLLGHQTDVRARCPWCFGSKLPCHLTKLIIS